MEAAFRHRRYVVMCRSGRRKGVDCVAVSRPGLLDTGWECQMRLFTICFALVSALAGSDVSGASLNLRAVFMGLGLAGPASIRRE